MDDQNWSTKYWTTISATDLVSGSGDDEKVIPSSNIKIKRWNDTPTMLSWWYEGVYNTWVIINPILSGYQSLDKPIKYFIYDSDDVPNWKLWMYGDNPEILIDLSEWNFSWCTNSNPCTYKWTITYTLYEKE